MAQIDHQNDKTGSLVITTGSDKRLDVSARANSRLFYISRDKAGVFNWVSTYATSGSDEDVIYLKNDSSIKQLFIDRITVGTTVNNVFTPKFVTGTAGGASGITAVNWNNGVNASATDTTATGNAEVTGLVDAGILVHVRVAANEHHIHDFKEAVILGQGDAIAVGVASAGTIEVTITGALE